jgi:hypothetical protein
MPKFNQHGYLQPDRAIAMDYADFVETFVFNQHRADLFAGYLKHQALLSENNIPLLYQWVDGSFASQKGSPKDIDVVNFVPADVYQQKTIIFRAIKEQLTKIDAYFVCEYPADHPKRFITDFDRTEWLHLFSTDRKRRKKGFVELNFITKGNQ